MVILKSRNRQRERERERQKGNSIVQRPLNKCCKFELNIQMKV